MLQCIPGGLTFPALKFWMLIKYDFSSKNKHSCCEVRIRNRQFENRDHAHAQTFCTRVVAEIVLRGKDNHAQHDVNYVAEWSSCNLMQLNAAKCKELVADFKKCNHSFETLFVSDKNLTVVQDAKDPRSNYIEQSN